MKVTAAGDRRTTFRSPFREGPGEAFHVLRYLFIASLLLICSSFNLCEKKVMTDGRLNRIYIYPDCNDTSCYLKQRYQAHHVVEYLFIDSRMRYKRILDKMDVWIMNEYTYDANGKHEVHVIDTLRNGIPDKTFAVNDTCALNIEYFGDGGYHICSYGYNRKNECIHAGEFASTIVFDSTYAGKMEGRLQIICDTNSVTDAFSGEELVKIVHRERQTGKWYTYNTDGRRTDSTVYKPAAKQD